MCRLAALVVQAITRCIIKVDATLRYDSTECTTSKTPTKKEEKKTSKTLLEKKEAEKTKGFLSIEEEKSDYRAAKSITGII